MWLCLCLCSQHFRSWCVLFIYLPSSLLVGCFIRTRLVGQAPTTTTAATVCCAQAEQFACPLSARCLPAEKRQRAHWYRLSFVNSDYLQCWNICSDAPTHILENNGKIIIGNPFLRNFGHLIKNLGIGFWTSLWQKDLW